MASTFFTLTPKESQQFRLGVFSQIHQIVFHGQGGYDWNTVYNMPLWLRKYTFSEIKNYNEEANKQIEEAKSGKKGQKNLINADGTVNTPEFMKASQDYKGKTGYK